MIYSGDPDKWKLFANTFKLKMGILLADIDPATASSVITAAVKAGVFASNGDNALYHFLSSPPYTNQAWVGLVQSGRYDYVATDTYMTLLGAQGKVDGDPTISDPRTPYYFAVNADGNYLGAPNAVTTITYSDFSLPAGSQLTPGNPGNLANADAPGDLLDYSETQFYLAEAT